MQFELLRDPEQFIARAWPLLSARIDFNVLATMTMTVLDHFHPGALFGLGSKPDGLVAWAALRTPPWPMIASELEPALAPRLMELWLHEDPNLQGVNGPPATARGIATAWGASTGRDTRCRTTMAMHALEKVRDPPRPAPGRLRVAAGSDRPRLADWWRAFARDAGVVEGDDLSGLDARLNNAGVLVWEDPEPVCMVAITRPVAGIVRIGPVYTPDPSRRRGYAATAVAQVSRRALAGGARTCMLYTDLSNPTSNKIYAEVGYRWRGNWEEHEFLRA